MREIKFRQWNPYNRTWHYFEFKDGCCSGVINATLRKYPIYQFTGLHDKNGKEIYEGDIVKSLMTGAVYLIYWNFQYMAWFKKCLNVEKKDIFMYQDNDRVFKIGNIHENPELLEDDQ